MQFQFQQKVNENQLAKTTLRGLNNFIRSIHHSCNHEEEQKIVDKELAHIRNEFITGKKLEKHGRRKYIMKLMYIYILGYDFDFATPQIIELIGSNKFADKLVGYIATTLFISQSDDFTRLIINTLNQDLCHTNKLCQSAALNVISCIGNKEMSEILGNTILQLLFSPTADLVVKKKAALTVTHLYKKNEFILKTDPNFQEKFSKLFMSNDLGVIACASSLLLEIVKKDPKGWEGMTTKLLNILSNIITNKYSVDNNYKGVTSPWLQIRILKIFRYIQPTDGPEVKLFIDIISKIIDITEVGNKQVSENTKNTLLSILFEINHLASILDLNINIKERVCTILGNYLSVKETNIRYLALDALAFMCQNGFNESAKKYLPKMIGAMREIDISIRKRALIVLFNVCDDSCYETILKEMLMYLQYCDSSIREDLVIKISLIAEKFAKSPQWYVDIMLQLTAIAGDIVPDNILNRVIKLIVNNDSVQHFAAKMTYKYLQNATWRENFIRLSSYILGEYSHLIVSNNQQISPKAIFDILSSKFVLCCPSTKYYIINAIGKMRSYFPSIENEIDNFFNKFADSIEIEISNRINEYKFIEQNHSDLQQLVFEPVPSWEGEEGNNDIINDEEFVTTTNDEETIRKNIESNNDDILSMIEPTKTKSSTNTNSNDLLSILNSTIVETNQTNQQPVMQNLYPQSEPIQEDINNNNNNDKDIEDELTEVPNEFEEPNDEEGYNGCQMFGIQNEIAEHMKQIHKQLVLQVGGLLYQDNIIQIGMKSIPQSPSCQVALFFGSRIQQPLPFKYTIKCPEGLTVQNSQFQSTINPTSQVQSVLLFTATSFYSQSPTIKLEYNNQIISFSIPLAINAFMISKPLEPQVFMQSYNSVQGQYSTTIINDNFNSIDIKTILGGMRFAVLDYKQTQIVACNCFPSFSEMYCLLRLEIEPQNNTFKVSTRSQDPKLAKSIHDLLVYELSKI